MTKNVKRLNNMRVTDSNIINDDILTHMQDNSSTHTLTQLKTSADTLNVIKVRQEVAQWMMQHSYEDQYFGEENH